MPRELISREVEHDYAKDGESWLERRVYDLTVQWTRADLPVEADLPALDSVQVAVREAVYGPPQEEFPDGLPLHGSERFSSALSRKQINHLIKTLRKARDQVFGVDE
jgi:hypothetical protein